MKRYLKGIISVVLTVGVSYGVIYAWINGGLQSESGDTLTSSKWNQLVNIAETNSGKLTGISNSNGTLTATAFVGDGSSLTNLPAGSSVFAGSIKIGDDAGACDGSKAGAIRWTGSGFQGCNGVVWG